RERTHPAGVHQSFVGRHRRSFSRQCSLHVRLKLTEQDEIDRGHETQNIRYNMSSTAQHALRSRSVTEMIRQGEYTTGQGYTTKLPTSHPPASTFLLHARASLLYFHAKAQNT
ncbi:unnamed protein product, partial [Ectocarpus sp. 12 AP-2014]